MSFFGFLLVPKSLFDRVDRALDRIETNQWQQAAMLAALNAQGVQTMEQVQAVKAAVGRVFEAIDRGVGEMRELFLKIPTTQDQAELQALADQLNAKADSINAAIAEVDLDGSNAPKTDDPPAEG